MSKFNYHFKCNPMDEFNNNFKCIDILEVFLKDLVVNQS